MNMFRGGDKGAGESGRHKPILLLELSDAVLRQWWTIVAGGCLGLAVAVVALEWISPLYEAKATIFVASSRLPQEMIQSTVADATEIRLKSLKDAVLGRPSLLKILNETVGPVESEEAQNAAVMSLRSRAEARYSEKSQSLEVLYRDSDRDRAAAIANRLAERYVEENARFRAGLAEDTAGRFEELADGALVDLQEWERKVREFLARNPGLSVAAGELRVEDVRQLTTSLDENRKAQAEIVERIAVFRQQLAQDELLGAVPAPRPSAARPDDGAPTDARLAKLQAELNDLLLRYTPDHPDVKAKQRTIDRLVAELREAPAPATPDQETLGEIWQPRDPERISLRAQRDPKAATWRAQIVEEQRKLQQLQAEEQTLQGQLASHRAQLDRAPVQQQQLDEMNRGLQLAKNRYDSYLEKLNTAREAQKIEEKEWGSRFEIIDSAGPPAKPVWPNPLLVAGPGLLGGLLCFVGPVLLKRFLNPVVGSEAGLVAISSVPVLVVVPRLITPSSARQARRSWRRNLGFSLTSIVILVAVVVVLA